MPLYVMLTRLTDEGRRTIKERPGRIKEVNAELEQMGAGVIAQYAVLGPYDFVNIVEAADNEAIARVSLALGARGTMEIMTMPVVDFGGLLPTPPGEE
jgi:uncharacterized protein with GYD domain